MTTKKEAQHVAKPVVLIAEELSPATLEALGPDFEVRKLRRCKSRRAP
jgi:D-3-phosphoglycerate dehydrogenase / 2-oxoglutarate reductase